MKKKKITKKVQVAKQAKKPIKKTVVKPAKKIEAKQVKAPTNKKVVVKVSAAKKAQDTEKKAELLIGKGKERGFITYDEILKSFPTVEDDVVFLDSLYERLTSAGIDILEGGGFLDIKTTEDDFLKKYGSKRENYDSIQMYLKEIGQYPLIHAAEEKDLATDEK